MSFDAGKNDLVMGIIGTGVMGRGIAQIAAQSGVSVLMHDAKPGAALDAQKSVHATLSKLAEKGKITAQAAEAAVGRISIVDGLEGFSGADVVVEAIVENIQAKHQLFQSLEEVVGDG